MNDNKDILFTSTVDEVVGAYRPGTAPMLFINENISAGSIQAHETGHRQLCDTSALGLYMSGMSTAILFVPSVNEAQLRSIIQSLIEQCWLCQEGYATFRQVSYTQQFDIQGEYEQLIASLPESYATALDIFNLDSDLNRDLLQAELQHVPEQGRYGFMWLVLEHAAYVLGRSAMSVPVSNVLNAATSLPDYDVITAVRQDPPDVRLKSLRLLCDKDFILDVTKHFLLAIDEIDKTGTSRPLDDRMDACARKLCQKAGVAYEPSYALDVPKMLEKLGVKGVGFADQRDMPLEESLARETDSRTVHQNWYDGVNEVDELTVEDVASSFNKMCANLSPEDHHMDGDIVCELMPLPMSDAEYYPMFHLFLDSKVIFDNEDHDVHIKLTKTAPQCKKGEDPTELPARIPHRSWTWIMHWSMFLPDNNGSPLLDYDAFARQGPVYSPLFPGEITPKGKLQNTSGSPCYVISSSSGLEEIPGSKTMITEYDCEEIKPTIIVSKPSNEALSKLPHASPEACRVTYALMGGAYSLLGNRFAGGI